MRKLLRLQKPMVSRRPLILGGGGSNPAATLLDYEAYWRFDGDGLDQSINDLDLTPSASVTFNTGKINNAAYLPNTPTSNLSHTVANHVLEPGADDFEVCGWVWFNTGGATNSAFVSHGQAGPGVRGYTVSGHWTGSAFRLRLRLSSDGSAFSDLNDVNDLAVDTWHFFRAGLDNANDTMFIASNGNAAVTQAYASNVNSPNVPFMVGTLSDGATWPLTGRIDAVGWWRRLLTSEERTYLFGGNQL